MSTETNQDETSQPPFQFGDVVRHQSGDVIKVDACKRVVAHSHLRWAVYDANGNRFWARNCGLVERPRATPDDFLGVSAIDGTKVYSASPADLRAEIETLAKQRDEAREELKEATAEFVRALAIANRERDEANLVAKSNLLKLSEWQAVVVRCEQLLKMNGPPCEHPAWSAVPLQLEHRLKSLALAEKVIRDAKEVLEQKAT